MLFRRIALLLSFLFLTTACNDDAINNRDMIVIAHHYPKYLSCGFVLEVTLNRMPAISDTLALEKEGNVTCADYGRDENNNTLEHSCFIKNYDADNGNDTCVIGVNVSSYVGDAKGLFEDLIGTAETAEDNASK